MNIQAMLSPLPPSTKFVDERYYIWGASMVRDEAGLCHMLYARWPRHLTHAAWVTHSEVAHAVADHPLGPYRHVDVALPARGQSWWDGMCTHNPTVHCFAGKYYLYYMGNTGDGDVQSGFNWKHRNNQRIGVATADHPSGPWKRSDRPLIDVGEGPSAPDALMTSNPAVTQMPDGRILLIYKAVGKQHDPPFGGPVVHIAATAASPEGPFHKHDHPIFTIPGERFPAEDPSIWRQGDMFWAIVKDNAGHFTHAGKSLALFQSNDGLDWRLAEHPLVSRTEVQWQGGQRQTLHSLERPQIWLDNGVPAVLFCAADEDRSRPHSFNLHIPLTPPSHQPLE